MPVCHLCLDRPHLLMKYVFLKASVLLLVCSCWRTLASSKEQEVISLKQFIAAITAASCSVQSVDIVTSCSSPVGSPDRFLSVPWFLCLCAVSQKAAGVHCTCMVLQSFTDTSFLVLLSGTTLCRERFSVTCNKSETSQPSTATRYLRESCPV